MCLIKLWFELDGLLVVVDSLLVVSHLSHCVSLILYGVRVRFALSNRRIKITQSLLVLVDVK
jgi:hypothetical protein